MAQAIKFYGFSHKEVMQMPVDTFEMYWEAMGVIDAQSMMRSFTIQDYPNAKAETRKRLHRQIHKKAYPDTWDSAKPRMTMDQFFGKPRVKDGQ